MMGAQCKGNVGKCGERMHCVKLRLGGANVNYLNLYVVADIVIVFDSFWYFSGAV